MSDRSRKTRVCGKGTEIVPRHRGPDQGSHDHVLVEATGERNRDRGPNLGRSHLEPDLTAWYPTRPSETGGRLVF